MTVEQNQAFAAAYQMLREQYPVRQKYKGVERRKEYDRDLAFQTALNAGDLWMVVIFSSGIPEKEIRAIHALIYG